MSSDAPPTGRVRIRLDAEACVGHGRCYALAPRIFGADDLGHCEVLLPEPPPDLLPAARTAVSSCPEDALRLDEL